MNDSPGVTLISPSDLNLNMNNQQEEDEEDIEEQRRRKEMLNAQLEHAFDDWSESEHESDSGNSSTSEEEDGNKNNARRVQQVANDLVFRNLSNISEHSPNKTGCQSAEQSKDGNEHSGLQNRFVFSSPRSVPYKFIQSKNGGTITSIDGRGDESQLLQSDLKNVPNNETHGQFQHIFINNSLSEKSHSSFDETSEPLKRAVEDGRGDENHKYEPIFNNSSNVLNGEKFQHIFTKQSESLGSIEETAEAYRQADYNSVEQLRVLYEVRLREIKELQAKNIHAANENQKMFRQLALLEAEKQREVLSRTEASKLLVASKEEIRNLQKETETLKHTIEALETNKIKSEETTEILKVHIEELEHKIELMERFDSNKTAVKHTEAVIKELKNKHQQEVGLIQREMDSLNKKLYKKENDCGELEQKVAELQRAQEVLLMEKTETINQLASRLKESQAQCSQLMSSNISVDNVRLQNKLTEALREREELSQTVKGLQAECNIMRSDLSQYESLAQLHSQSSSDETDSIVQLGISSRKKVNNLNTSDMMARLKGELHRAFLNQKAKRSEIQRLQESIQDKDKQLREKTEQERIHLSEIETLNEQLNKMLMEIKSLREQNGVMNDFNSQSKSEEVLNLNAQVAELQKAKAILESERIDVKKKLDDLTKRFDEEKRREISDHNKEYLKFHDEIIAKVKRQMEEEAELKIKEYSMRLEHSLKEMNNVKEMYVAVCSAKEEVTVALGEAKTQIQQITAERDRLEAELTDSRRMADQLARHLNESGSNKGDEESAKLRAELKEYVEMRDHLARRINIAERDNAKLVAEVDKLKTELEKKLSASPENVVCGECSRLQAELKSMSARHTQELSCARIELQAARDRLVQLEKSARQQFDTEIKTLRQDRDLLKVKCDEKEAQIKKLIESRKRPPATVNVSTQTEVWEVVDGCVEGMEGIERRLREEYDNNLTVMEQAHQEAVAAVKSRTKKEVERLEQEHQQLLGATRQQYEQQQAEIRAAHMQELRAVEEKTKQLTLEFCAVQIKKVEEKYMEEAFRRADPTIVETLQKTLQEKNVEIGNLKLRLTALQHQMEADRDNASQLMMQWAQELKNVQGEIQLKEAIIDDQRSQIQKESARAEKYRRKVKRAEAEHISKCNQFKADFLQMIEDDKKLVDEKVMQMQQSYEKKVKELRKEMSKKKHSK